MTSNSYSQTNAGICITIPLHSAVGEGSDQRRTRYCVGFLNCVTSKDDSVRVVALRLVRLADGGNQFARYRTSYISSMALDLRNGIRSETVYVRNVIPKDAIEVPKPTENEPNHRARFFAWLLTGITTRDEIEVCLLLNTRVIRQLNPDCRPDPLLRIHNTFSRADSGRYGILKYSTSISLRSRSFCARCWSSTSSDLAVLTHMEFLSRLTKSST